jgi:hypothetical protein
MSKRRSGKAAVSLDFETARRLKAVDVRTLAEVATAELDFDNEDLQIAYVMNPRAFWRYVAGRRNWPPNNRSTGAHAVGAAFGPLFSFLGTLYTVPLEPGLYTGSLQRAAPASGSKAQCR